MTEEVMDELDTPGCPNCVIKHLSAALVFHKLYPLEPACDDPYEYAARAFVNLSEVLSGYRSHADFAAGLMVRAEETGALLGPEEDDFLRAVRSARLSVVAGGHDGAAVRKAMSVLAKTIADYPDKLALAHLAEAWRECPRDMLEHLPTSLQSAEQVQDAIGKFRKEFFNAQEN